MHSIGEYMYDPERLIFYKKDLSSEAVAEILENIAVNDKHTEHMDILNGMDASSAVSRERKINLIGVCLTYNCQLRCNYCSYSSEEGKEDFLKSDDVLALVVEAIKRWKMHCLVGSEVESEPLRFFFTGGGEPTYNWDLFEECVLKIKNKCQHFSVPYYFELTMNGVINNLQREFIKNNFDKVMISYDGISELQDANRRSFGNRTTSHVVEETIKYFIANEVPVTIRSTVWPDDFKHMRDMHDYLCNTFVAFAEWSIMPIIPVGRALTKDTTTSRDNSNRDFFDYYVDLINYAKEVSSELYISTPVFYNSIVVEFCCGATFVDCFWLLPDKSITNCIEAETFQIAVGKIDDGKVNFSEPYEDTFLDVVRQTFVECRSCIAYRFCKGGCPLKSLRDAKYKTNHRKHECSMIVKYWEYIFHKVLSGENCFGWCIAPIDNANVAQYGIFELSRVEED